MKCPKCGYLGFEAVDRCRNCGYEFSLSTSVAVQELPIRTQPAEPAREMITELPLFGDDEDDAPLVNAARPPRPPLAVRRATPETPRVRPTPQPRAPMLDLDTSDAAVTPPPSLAARREAWPPPKASDADEPGAASLGARLLAALVDLFILTMVDAAVVYFTMQICGLEVTEFAVLPKGPLVAFLLVQNGGYLAAFTAGGQTLGKMMTGIKVVPVRSDTPLDLAHAVVRTLVWAALAVPAGLGFLTTLVSGDHRGLHDRLSGTKVVRASA